MPTNNSSGGFTRGAAKRIARIVHRGMRRPDLPQAPVRHDPVIAGVGQFVKLTSNMTAYTASTKQFGYATGTLQFTTLASDGFTLSHFDSAYPDVYVYNSTAATPVSGSYVQVKVMQRYYFADVGSC